MMKSKYGPSANGTFLKPQGLDVLHPQKQNSGVRSWREGIKNISYINEVRHFYR